MKKVKFIRISILVLLAVVFAYAAYNLGKTSIAAAVGDPAPDFTLEDMEGNMVSLTGYKGQFVVLNFFTTWCPPCREEAPELQKFQELYGNKVKLLILDRAEPKVTVEEFIDEFQSTSTYLLDYNDSMARPYGVLGQPETFFIDENGIIRFHKKGTLDLESMINIINNYIETPLEYPE